MKLKDLLDKATPRPWLDWAVTISNGKNAHGKLAILGADDAALITTLANNAEAFIELWEAADVVVEGVRREPLQPGDEPIAEDRVLAAVEALRPLMEADDE